MSQAAPPAPAPARGTPRSYVDTPALLSRWTLMAVATVVAFAVLSAVVQILSWQSDGRAADDTEQLVRVQGIESSLRRADALSTNGYLTSGLESTTRQHEYDAVISDALEQIADAARAQPADRAALAALNQQVDEYTTKVARAAVYNRQGLPIGIAYQTAASSQLRDGAVPIVDALIKANSERSQDSMGGQHPWWLLLFGVLALVALFLVNRQVARAFRRRINTGLAVAAVIVLLVTVVTGIAAAVHAHGNAGTRDGAYHDAVVAATARTAADDAKANESLRLITRGSGQAYETSWEDARSTVERSTPDAQLTDWSTYVQRHQRVVHLDEDNQWKTAVGLATTTERTGSTAPLDAFDKAMKQRAADSGARAADELRGGRTLALLLALLTLLFGVVAAVAVARGIDERRKEFL